MEEREENIYTMMMEALDGELSETGLNELESHLRVRPDLAREWVALQAIDRLFRNSPILSPAVDFTQRTLARLPNRRVYPLTNHRLAGGSIRSRLFRAGVYRRLAKSRQSGDRSGRGSLYCLF